jgi:hypothetical protein
MRTVANACCDLTNILKVTVILKNKERRHFLTVLFIVVTVIICYKDKVKLSQVAKTRKDFNNSPQDQKKIKGDGWLSWLCTCMLRQLSGFESRHLPKIPYGRRKQRSGQHTLARQKKYKKD